MINIIITLSHILVFLLLSSAVVVNGQSSSLPPPPAAAASPNATPPNQMPSLDPTIVALVCVFLFVGFFSVYLHHSFNAHGGHRSITSTDFHSNGIDPKLLNTFPILPCSAVVRHLKSETTAAMAEECAVCLTEFDHRDKLRLLPTCNHVFHPPCIDAWLASHVTCPVCRTWLKSAGDRRRRHGGNDVVIVIPDEVMDERCESRREPYNCWERRSLVRCHSTGHSMEMKETEDLRRQIMVAHGGMRRSVSYNVFR